MEIKFTNFNFFYFILISSFLLKYLLHKNIKKYNSNLNQLIHTNDELYKSNERYDLVAKATSDTIWEWNIKTGEFTFNKGIEGVFGYKKEEIGNTIDWRFSKIHHEDSIKIYVNIHSYVEQKIEK